ncbi:ADP-ribosylation factor-like protein 6-interacting protein 4 [Cephus cinctus]|uniref:ADP-ribosylation factor-like protein 6-interacting protein 4 n=1 Tax=Cephus cinctus TaxID=211228 RepID=A0AAJ7FI98_CEPCN|nr:ADP-ribosylation factor-like protein 6-interacting protein 4 [Cephus cinctus]
MNDSVRRKSRSKDRGIKTPKKKKLRKSSTSSTSSSDSDVSVKRRNACSKDKRKKSKRSSTSSSSSSSPDTAHDRSSKDRGTRSKTKEKSKERTNGTDMKRTFSDRKPYGWQNRYHDKSYTRNTYFSRYSQNFERSRGRNRWNRNYRDQDPRASNRSRDYSYKSSQTRENYINVRKTPKDPTDENTNAISKNVQGGSLTNSHPCSSIDNDIISKKSKKQGRSRSSSTSSSSNTDVSSSSSSSSNSSSSSSSTSEDEKLRKKRKKLAKKLKKAKKKRRKKKDKIKKLKKKMKLAAKEKKAKNVKKVVTHSEDRLLKDIPHDIPDRARAMAPMTKEEWEKRQSVVRRVYDEETGRHRLIKGDGEVLEEIVSRDRHKEINRQATRGDGEYFQTQLKMNK